jgi:hypothetical protein
MDGDKAVDSVEGALKCVGLRFQGTSELDGPRQCHHDGPPMESRPCEIQARTATRRADRAWREGPRRAKELCGGPPGGAGEPDGDSALAEAPDGGSEFSPGSSGSESDTDCFESCDPRSPDPEEDFEPSEAESRKFRPLEAGSEGSESSESESSETESEDSDSSEAESGESDPFDMEARRRCRLTSSSSDSDSSSASSDSEESDSSSADSGFAKPSSSDTEVDFTPSAPSLEETEEFGRKVIGLSGRASWQVRKLLAVLTRMRRDLPPSARMGWVGLGWRLGPGLEAGRASAEDSGPEPTQAPEGGNQIRKFLEDWQRKYKESEERYRAERDEAFRSDDKSAQDEERLAAERAAELEKRTKMVEKHVATAETHLRYAEGHLQPPEAHLADAEVHLKLIKAHLTALMAMEPADVEPPETAALPPPESMSDEHGPGQGDP